ncbi:exodeoxyribonuclease I [Undibacterium sp. SXout7W]|uniref:exodeoxyribonuclease I n=1 Tax=Undibacterium sp. SXout7W TaxID=3413049 RepID=UPI003BF0CB69
MQDYSFLWHDYETFGAQARRDRPAQFAAIRTDAELNEIGEAMMLYCQPAPDFLPDPQSCLITGITPQTCLQRGIPEYQFAAQIEAAFSQSGTIGVGYNTIRFDDEITRFLFWRNLIDPYAREWQNNCGRWDILDVVRTAYALRPEGIQWPRNDDGKVSFKLEHLSAANHLAHDAAHDALSDVRATIALARLIRQQQPRLFEFCLGLRKKDRVMDEIGHALDKPFLHISGMIPVEYGCLSVMWPLAVHPQNKNEIIAWDLRDNPAELWELDAATIQQRMFSKIADLPEGIRRLPIKTIHINKSPMVISNLKTLTPALAAQWQIDMEQIQAHAAIAATAPDMSATWRQVFDRGAPAVLDVDEDLYGGFIGAGDKRLLNDLRQMTPAQLAQASPVFQDARLPELVFRYRARNFPETLSEQEQNRWEHHRAARLHEGQANALTVEQFFERIDQFSESADEQQEEILGALYDYAEHITPSR